MLLSIITVNYRSWRHLEKLLLGLASAPELGDGRWQIIVVDNDSKDGQLQTYRERFPMAQFVQNSGNFGFAHGNNLGARHATGKSLLFVNPDVHAEPAAIRKLLQIKASHPGVSLLSAQQVDNNGNAQKAFDRFPNLLTYIRTIKSLLRRLSPLRYHPSPDPGERLVACDWISGSLILVDRCDFDRLGGWSEDFWMYAEDMDLCRRAADLGMARAYTDACRFVHVHGGASRRDRATALLTKQEAMISAHVFIQRHFTGLLRLLNHAVVMLRNLLPLALAALLHIITLGLIGGLRRRSQLLLGMVAYYFSAMRNRTWLSPRSVNYQRRT